MQTGPRTLRLYPAKAIAWSEKLASTAKKAFKKGKKRGVPPFSGSSSMECATYIVFLCRFATLSRALAHICAVFLQIHAHGQVMHGITGECREDCRAPNSNSSMRWTGVILRNGARRAGSGRVLVDLVPDSWRQVIAFQERRRMLLSLRSL